jgi:putative flippase GtrA
MVNTLIHWSVFALLRHGLTNSQAIGNFAGFCVAAVVSFLINTNVIYQYDSSAKHYWPYMSAMGLMSIVFGLLADRLDILGRYTLLSFTIFSLICGFLYSNRTFLKLSSKE